MNSKKILIIITGSIAAFKAIDLIRELLKQGHEVTTVLTKGGSEFVSELTLASITGNTVHTELFDADAEVKMDHIQLSRSADFILVAPATANFIAKAANGLADCLASTLLLATNKPVYIAPAMNVFMWNHPATQRNIKHLTEDGITLIGPDEGDLACGETGKGRLSEVNDIISELPLD